MKSNQDSTETLSGVQLIINQLNSLYNGQYLITLSDDNVIIYREKKLEKNLVDWFTICKFHTVPVLIKMIKNFIETDKKKRK